jgi:hypothetical protein
MAKLLNGHHAPSGQLAGVFVLRRGGERAASLIRSKPAAPARWFLFNEKPPRLWQPDGRSRFAVPPVKLGPARRLAVQDERNLSAAVLGRDPSSIAFDKRDVPPEPA